MKGGIDVKQYQVRPYEPKWFEKNDSFSRLSPQAITNGNGTISSPNLLDNFVIQSGRPFLMSK